MKIALAFVCLLSLCSATLTSSAQPPAPRHIQSGSRVYIEPMNGFEVYLSAAIIQKKVPVTVVDDKAKADYIIAGTSHVDKASWAKTIFISPAPQAGASIAVKDAKTGDLIYAYAVDKFNSVRANQSTAEACAKHMKEDIAKATKW